MKYELLAPAGDMECLKWAIEAGCDAVYLGGSRFGARAFSKNFNDVELGQAINYAHLYGVKVYLTCNTLVYESEVEEFVDFVRFAYQKGIDAVLIQDLGMYDLIHQKFPDLEIHASTQMHIHNLEGAMVAKKLGFKRIVLARETNLETIKKIKEETGLDIEVFVHGSLCVSYSGQCLFSSLVGGRSGNRGSCAGSCRLPYDILSKDNEVLNKDKKYPLSMKDLCAISSIGNLIDIGVNSFKIEGRMKSREYVYLVTKLYRDAIDSYLKTGKVFINYDILGKLKKVFNREYTLGYLNNVFNNDVINGKQPNNVGVKIGNVIKIKGKNILIRLSDELHINDGLRIKSKDKEIGVLVNDFYLNGKLVKEASKDDIISILVKGDVSLDSDVYLTSSKYIEKEIEEYIKENPRKVKIKGVFEAFKDEVMSFRISDGKNSVIIREYTPEIASKLPTSKETIKDKLNKLGNSVYTFEELEIDMDDNLFIPLPFLNEIKRKAISCLDEKRLRIISSKEEEYYVSLSDFDASKNINAYIHYDNEIESPGRYKYVYCTDKKTKYIRAYSNVVKEYDKSKDLVLVGELGGLLLDNIHTDYSFNVVNSYTIAFLHRMGVKKITLSLELTRSQIKEMLEEYIKRYGVRPNVEVIVYGYEKVMTMKYLLDQDYLGGVCLQDKFGNKYYYQENNGYCEIYYHKKLDNREVEYYSLGVNHLRYNLYKIK